MTSIEAEIEGAPTAFSRSLVVVHENVSSALAECICAEEMWSLPPRRETAGFFFAAITCFLWSRTACFRCFSSRISRRRLRIALSTRARRCTRIAAARCRR